MLNVTSADENMGSGSGVLVISPWPQQHLAIEVLTNWLVSADKSRSPSTSYIMTVWQDTAGPTAN